MFMRDGVLAWSIVTFIIATVPLAVSAQEDTEILVRKAQMAEICSKAGAAALPVLRNYCGGGQSGDYRNDGHWQQFLETVKKARKAEERLAELERICASLGSGVAATLSMYCANGMPPDKMNAISLDANWDLFKSKVASSNIGDAQREEAKTLCASIPEKDRDRIDECQRIPPSNIAWVTLSDWEWGRFKERIEAALIKKQAGELCASVPGGLGAHDWLCTTAKSASDLEQIRAVSKIYLGLNKYCQEVFGSNESWPNVCFQAENFPQGSPSPALKAAVEAHRRSLALAQHQRNVEAKIADQSVRTLQQRSVSCLGLLAVVDYLKPPKAITKLDLGMIAAAYSVHPLILGSIDNGDVMEGAEKGEDIARRLVSGSVEAGIKADAVRAECRAHFRVLQAKSR